MADKASQTIILSAGGTGGHVLPAAALAEELRARGFPVILVTDKRGVRYKNHFGDVPVTVLAAGTLGSGLAGKIKGVAALGLGVVQAFMLLLKTRPAVVVGFGGYPSFPAVFAAQCLGVPTVLHEQNAVLGKANAMLMGRAKRVALSLPGQEQYTHVVVTGNPVRKDIIAQTQRDYIAPEGILRVFVMGGSLGASVFASVVPQTLAALPEEDRMHLEVIQQCRAADLEKVALIYKDAGIPARLGEFFDDVPEILSLSHLVICRSGASTVAELAAAGRPALFVPYPHHADQQQLANARPLEDAGAAWIMEEESFTEAALLAKMRQFLSRPDILRVAAEKARACGRPDAAAKLADTVETVLAERKA